MKSTGLIISLGIMLMVFPQCAKKNFAPDLAGTWEWIGDSCDTSGNCTREIMTDEGSRETFTAEGLRVTKRSRNGYTLDGTRVSFESTSDSCGEKEAEIISVDTKTMLLRCGGTIKKYGRVAAP
jgi:hypothetical protein